MVDDVIMYRCIDHFVIRVDRKICFGGEKCTYVCIEKKKWSLTLKNVVSNFDVFLINFYSRFEIITKINILSSTLLLDGSENCS